MSRVSCWLEVGRVFVFVHSVATFGAVMGPPPKRGSSSTDAASGGGGGLGRDRSRSPPPGALADRVVLNQVDALLREVRALRGSFVARVETGGSFVARIDALVEEVRALRTVLESRLPGAS